MSATMRIAPLVLIVAVIGLGACASAPVSRDSGGPVTHFDPAKDPYWQDPRWDGALGAAIQAVVHDPVDAADTSTPGLHAKVKFTYLNGVIEYPEITASTGNPDLDKLMLRQVALAQIPRPTGLQSDQPHEFELALDMSTPYEAFESGIYDAFDAQKVYSRESVTGGYQGIVTVSFDYLDGKLSNIVITKSSHNDELNKQSLGAITRAAFPPTPAAYAGKTLHMEASFCYALYQSEDDARRCPIARDMILVTGTRIKR